MEKLSEESQNIPDDKQIEQKFDLKSDISGIAGQEI